jgi:hypothetical protein
MHVLLLAFPAFLAQHLRFSVQLPLLLQLLLLLL